MIVANRQILHLMKSLRNNFGLSIHYDGLLLCQFSMPTYSSITQGLHVLSWENLVPEVVLIFIPYVCSLKSLHLKCYIQK